MSFKQVIDLEKAKKKFKITRISKNKYVGYSKVNIPNKEEFTEGTEVEWGKLPFLIGRSAYYYAYFMRHMYAITQIKKSSMTVLDIGCAAGAMKDLIHRAMYIGHTYYIGVDAKEKSIDKAAFTQSSGNFFLLQDHITGTLSYIKSESIDVIFAMEILEHMNEKQGNVFIKDLRRMLKKDGVLLLSTPNVEVTHHDFHVIEYTVEEAQKKLGKYFNITDTMGWDYLQGNKKVEKYFSSVDKSTFQALSKYVKPALLRQIFVSMYPELASAVLYRCVRK